MKKGFIKCVIISAWIIFGAFFLVINVVNSESLSNENYHDWISESYDFRFGKDKPFAPSNATTFNGKFIDRLDFTKSARCGSCHTDMHPQWLESAHRNSFREPFYTKNVEDLKSAQNIASTRHCESCHNPTALFSGALTDKTKFKERFFDDEGVSCAVCHSIKSVNGRGIGGYTMGQPALMELEDGTRLVDASDQQIFNDIPSHKRAVMTPLMKKPEFCAACHKSQVPKELNDYKFIRAFAVGDEFQQSSFSKEVPHPFYTRDKESCNSCHMKKEPTEFFDASVKDGTIASHRWAASNTAIPLIYGYKKQFDKVVEFLKDDKVRVDIFAISQQENKSDKPKLIAPLNRQTFKIKSGDILTADVVITNKNIGHSFPPELRDFYEAYIEFTVLDGNNKELYKSGFIKKDGSLDDKAHDYKTYLVKGNGDFNNLHHIWQTKAIAYNNAIPSGKSDLSRYKFIIPENFSGEIKLNAKVQYRRFTRSYSDYVMGKPTDFPIVTMSEVEESFVVGEKTKTKESTIKPKEMPDWWRWNNYGIALLDQKQFPQAADAFDEVIDFKNEYRPVAYTNKALALMQMGGWQEADKLIDKTLKLDAENYRSIFQQGKVYRVLSRLDEAEANFKRVLEKYPNDRMTLQQLGELAKIKSEAVPPEQRDDQLKIAQDFYERILKIDPEDLSAVYNLMLIYQKLGLKDEAREKAAFFRDLKDDPQAAPIASDFLQKNWDVGNESLPYHTHDLIPFQKIWERENYLSIGNIDWANLQYFNPVAD
jgi:Tfp pilus assembly protein PilF